MMAMTTTPPVIMCVVAICEQPSAVNDANTSSAKQPNSNPSNQRLCDTRSRGAGEGARMRLLALAVTTLLVVLGGGSAISFAASVGLTAIVGPASMC
jgi:hypothetical protein